MCLITNQQEPFVADKDIHVFKLIKRVKLNEDDNIVTEYRSWMYGLKTNHVYEPGVLYETEMTVFPAAKNSGAFDMHADEHYFKRGDGDAKEPTHQR